MVEERESVEWKTFAGDNLLLNSTNPSKNVARWQDQEYINPNTPMKSPAKVVYLEARPKPGMMDNPYGIMGTYTVTLPEKRFIQFQGIAQLLDGRNEDAELYVQVNVRNQKISNKWIKSKVFEGIRTGKDEFAGIKQFVLDLSEWSGKEVQLALVLKVKPSYFTANGLENWNPAKISAQWGEANIVASRFKVLLGEPEEVNNTASAKTTYDRHLVSSATIEVSTGTTEEKVFDGEENGYEGDYYMENPGEMGEPSTLLPDTDYTDPHYVTYFGTRINGSAHARTASINFSGASELLTLATATVTQIQNNVLDENNDSIADTVLSGDSSSDDWPEYVTIAGLVVGENTSDSGDKYLHAFAHTEDQDSGTDKYLRISYARSSSDTHQSGFGIDFSKMDHSLGYSAIITHPSQEHTYDEVNDEEPNKEQLYGCGSPNIIEWGNYYYMIYDTRQNRYVSDPHYYYRGEPGITIARALKSSVNSPNYQNNGNPWKKFKEVDSDPFDSSNWTEPGIQGDYSFLINAETDGNGYRTNILADHTKWRAYPKVSYNEYLAQYFDNGEDHMVMLCVGNLSLDGGGSSISVMLYTSRNLIDWSEPLLIAADPDQDNIRYPTLIGKNDNNIAGFSSGWSGQTTEENQLYYQTDSPQDVYRRTLTFDVIE